MTDSNGHAGRSSPPAAGILLFAAFFVLFILGPKHYDDSFGYLMGDDFRSPIYPMVIDFFRFIFGGNFEWLLVAFQLTVGACAVYWFTRQLAKAFGLSHQGFALLLALCATPYFGLSIQAGNAILSEALAYPLFLIAMGFLVESVTEKKLKPAIYFFLITTLLVLTRKQFLFLFVMIIPFLVFLRYSGVRWSRLFALSVLVCCLVPLTQFAESVNNYIRHGKLSPVSYTGIQLIVGAIYVSKADDVRAIADLRQKRFFETIHVLATEKALTLDMLGRIKDERVANKFSHFFSNYHNLMNAAGSAFKEVYDMSGSEPEYREALDRATMPLAITLIRENPLRYATLYALNLSYGFGGHGIGDGYGLRGIYFLILQLSVLLYLVLAARNDPSQVQMRNIVIFLSLAHWSNVSEVALLEPVLDRYSFYTSTLWMMMIAALIARAIERPAALRQPE
jgi:hypothetical protein